MSSDVQWLTADEEGVWRGWLLLNSRINATLQREMQEESGISSQDFEVLVNLTDTADGRLRVSDLASQMLWERSRLSHHVTRMERRGIVERVECAEDGRGAWIAITREGRTLIEQAAPGHVASVRRLVFDRLSHDEVGTLGALVEKLLSGVDEASST